MAKVNYCQSYPQPFEINPLGDKKLQQGQFHRNDPQPIKMGLEPCHNIQAKTLLTYRLTY